MFFIRYRLHRQIYNHKAVKAIEILLVKLLGEIEKEFTISNYLLDPEKMIQLIDSYIWHLPTNNPIIIQLIQDINQRKIPKMVYQTVSLQPIEFPIDKLEEKFGSGKFHIVKFKVGYVGGKSSNPLNHITFYNSKTGQIIMENKVKSFSLLINQKHQEYFIRVYCNDLLIINQVEDYICELIENKKDLKKELNTNTNIINEQIEPEENIIIV
jgi:hypothetical protein